MTQPTPFTDENLYAFDGGEDDAADISVTYFGPNNQREFVARFKYMNAEAECAHFVAFLKANFTVEEYLAERAKGLSPAPILEAKGYICLAHKAAMLRLGVTNRADLGAALVEESARYRAMREGRAAC